MRGVRASLVLAFLAGLVFAAGCARRGYAEVEGTLTLDGEPLADVEVVFVPEPALGNAGNNATAQTDARGRYRLSTPKDRREAAAIGAYRVVVTDLLMVADLTKAGDPPEAGGGAAPPMPGSKKRRFPHAYGDVTDTPLKDVEVKAGRQTLDFDLKAAR